VLPKYNNNNNNNNNNNTDCDINSAQRGVTRANDKKQEEKFRE
jgi:hypothetical protein